ncbi:MAG: site-2 protease family protein [Clostridia bacterium]|nr:site-2 protease family protein [Clostridia bacterium]
MFRYLLADGDLTSYVIQFLLSLPIFLLALSLHETAHGYVAYRLGDPTARSMGRLTLNPLKHLDPIGFLCMVFFGFGWANPVPVNARYFKKPRRDMALSSVAGPISNILLAALFTLLLKLSHTGFYYLHVNSGFWATMLDFWFIFLILGVKLNAMLAVFNLLPIPPLDGSRILFFFLPQNLAYKLSRYERVITIVLLVALALGVLTPVINFLSDLIVKLLFTAGLLKDTIFWYFI